MGSTTTTEAGIKFSSCTFSSYKTNKCTRLRWDRGGDDAHQEEDLVQEVCLKAYRAFDRFERGTNYRAWLFRHPHRLFGG